MKTNFKHLALLKCTASMFSFERGRVDYFPEVLRMLIFEGNLCFCSCEGRGRRAKAALSVLQSSSEIPADTASSSSLSHIKLVVNVLF